MGLGIPASSFLVMSLRLKLALVEPEAWIVGVHIWLPHSSGQPVYKTHCKASLPVKAVATLRMSAASSSSRCLTGVTEPPPTSGTIHPAGLWLAQGPSLSLMIMQNFTCMWNGREQSRCRISACRYLLPPASPYPHRIPCSLG